MLNGIEVVVVEARAKAFILALVVSLAVFGSMLFLEDILAVSILLVSLVSVIFLLGFAFSPDARPPRIPPRSQTARPVLLPLGFSGLTITITILSGYRPISYYLNLGYLSIISVVTMTWLLGSFLARRMDSRYEPKSKKWLEAWDRYQIQKEQERNESEQDL